MEIVVSDTNILIDMYNAGLLSCLKDTPIQLRTLDLVIDEITNIKQASAIQTIIASGYLYVASLSPSQIATAVHKTQQYQTSCNLSFVDVSVMTYAHDNNFRLLTGDKVLRRYATVENISVSGILFLTDLITEQHILSNGQMCQALRKLLQSNPRLPKNLVLERIQRLQV